MSIAKKAVDDPNRTLALDERGKAALVPKPDFPEPDGHAQETHFVTRSGWLRAAVLGANDGLLSTGSLMSGVAAASVASSQLVLTGVAGIVAGAMSMAAGEYMSVAWSCSPNHSAMRTWHREFATFSMTSDCRESCAAC